MMASEKVASRLAALKEEVQRKTGVRLVTADEIAPAVGPEPTVPEADFAKLLGDATRLRREIELKDVEITDLRQMIALLKEQIALLKARK